MLCPKCGQENPQAAAECLRCGVIFAKIKIPSPPPAEPVLAEQHAAEPAGGGLRDLFLGMPDGAGPLLAWGRSLLLVGLVIWSARLILVDIGANVAGESLLHLINLPFHEAGHVLFRPFGRFVTTLGGTLGQLLVPLLCLGTLLLKTRDPFGAAVCCWWFGENFLDIAPYINDARAGALPLVGGNFGHFSPYGFHDWEYLLTETGLLRYDHLLARIAHGTGAVLMAAALGWAGWLVLRQLRRSGGAVG
jgi:hypothetical protein